MSDEKKNNPIKDYQCLGTTLDIFTYPAPILTKTAEVVTRFDQELCELCQNMLYTMYHAPGIGLAAPQIGKSLRLFVMDVNYKREEVTLPNGNEEFKLSEFNPQIFINPVIKTKEGEQTYEEGCLSLPGIYEEVKRAKSIIVEYQDVFGDQHELRADELESVCIQHENDHLDGIVFIERLGPIKKSLYKKKLFKQSKRNKNI